MFVLALDIRRSTFLMKEAVDFDEYAGTLNGFIDSARQAIRDLYRGWFDKFTGDGFLCYWVVEEAEHDDYHDAYVRTMRRVITMAQAARDIYEEVTLEQIRHNTRNLPAGVGVSIGLDAGPGYLVEMGGDLTIVGPPVVGAVRMVEAAKFPREIVANVYVGGTLSALKASTGEDHMDVDIRREMRPTKEYREGQEVYLINSPQPDSLQARIEEEVQSEDIDDG